MTVGVRSTRREGFEFGCSDAGPVLVQEAAGAQPPGAQVPGKCRKNRNRRGGMESRNEIVLRWCCGMNAGGECEVHDRHGAAEDDGRLQEQKARDRAGECVTHAQWKWRRACMMRDSYRIVAAASQHRAYAKIEKENRLLLERLSKAMQEKNIDNVNVKATRFRRSLMQTQRKLELQRITQENQVCDSCERYCVRLLVLRNLKLLERA